MADQTALYQGQANALYDPQLQASQGTAKAGYDANNLGYGVQTTATNNSYAEALKTLTATEQGGEAHNNMNAEVHGLFNSGLAANANRLTYAKYQDNVSTTSNNRAAKLAGIAASQQGNTLKYNAELGALASKYQGDKAGYVSGHVNADQKAAAQEAAAMQRMQIQEANANARSSRSSARTATNADPGKGYNVIRDSVGGGLQFHGKDGVPVTAAQYAQATGSNILSVLGAASDSGSQQAVKDINSGTSVGDLTKKYPWIFGGV